MGVKNKKPLKKNQKIVVKKYKVKNFEFLRTLSFGFFLSRHLQSLITQKLHERDEIFFLLFEDDEIAFDVKYVVSMEAPYILNYLHLNLKNNEKKHDFLGFWRTYYAITPTSFVPYK